MQQMKQNYLTPRTKIYINKILQLNQVLHADSCI